MENIHLLTAIASIGIGMLLRQFTIDSLKAKHRREIEALETDAEYRIKEAELKAWREASAQMDSVLGRR